MDRKMILSVLSIVVFGFIGIMLLMPENREDGIARLPWRIGQDPLGRTQVFGFTLGETTLAEVRRVFGEEGEINLFAQPDATGDEPRYAVEAYFEHIYLNRLRADFVVTLQTQEATLEPMYERGLRISQLGSGAKKVKLDPDDITTLLEAPIRAITYLPWKALDNDIIRNRFGAAERKHREQETGVVHWLYPDKGMDIAIDREGGVVIQYVNPAAFDDLIDPLGLRPIVRQENGRSVENLKKEDDG
jgi:hypothetical protein